jgi:choline dehydrogenase-like flavoprotein
VEDWVRGRTLGGSSSVNGAAYNRGSRADHDELERLGNPCWGWDSILPTSVAVGTLAVRVLTDKGRAVGARTCSVLPVTVSGGLNGPIMAMVWRAGRRDLGR